MLFSHLMLDTTYRVSNWQIQFLGFLDCFIWGFAFCPRLNFCLIKSSMIKSVHKVQKILKGSLDSTSSPSVKIQIMCKKVWLRWKGKTLLGIVNNVFKSLSCLYTYSAHNLILHWRRRWWDWIQAIFLILFTLIKAVF